MSFKEQRAAYLKRLADEKKADEKKGEPEFIHALTTARSARDSHRNLQNKIDRDKADKTSNERKSVFASYRVPKREAIARIGECEQRLLGLYRKSYSHLLAGTGYSVWEYEDCGKYVLSYKKPEV